MKIVRLIFLMRPLILLTVVGLHFASTASESDSAPAKADYRYNNAASLLAWSQVWASALLMANSLNVRARA